jgi:hypothetical protein
MARNKYDFIKELLTDKKLNQNHRERILELASKEISLEGTLEERVLKIEEIVFDGSLSLSNLISSENNKKPPTDNRKNARHKPRDTANFLMEFKRDDSGLKELVHEPNEEIDLLKILEKAKNSPFLSYDYYKKPSKHSVSFGVRNGAKELIASFEEIGIPFWKESKIFPFGTNGSSAYTKAGKSFKKNYRLGVERDGYSNLKKMLEDDLKKHLDSDAKVCFLPDNRAFNLRAHFITWIPFLRNGIQQILKDCEQERKNQKRKFQTIQFELTRNTENRTRTLSITDVGSISETSPFEFLKIKQECKMFKSMFRSLCDWSVEFFFEQEDKSYRINLLTTIENYSKDNVIVEINTKPNGFTHLLTFYDAD